MDILTIPSVGDTLRRYLVYLIHPLSRPGDGALIDSRLMANNQREAQERAEYIYRLPVLGIPIVPESETEGEYISIEGFGKHSKHKYWTLQDSSMRIEVSEVP